MSRNKCFVQVRISNILYFISICDIFTDSSSYMISIPGSVSLVAKRQECEAHYSPPSSAEVTNGGATPPLPTRPHGVALN
jgi:hypothetical protein